MKAKQITQDYIEFEDGTRLMSEHDQDCCEHHYLSFSDISIDDFENLEFDLSDDRFFERIEGYGIALKPLNGYPVRIPGYGSNNGFYSSNLKLVLIYPDDTSKTFDITECQDISG